MNQSTKKEKFFYHNNLVCLVKGLKGTYTTIDFRNESYITGIISEVDGYMNIELEDAVFYNNRGAKFPFDSFYVQARNVRYVHIPKDMPAREIMQAQIESLHRKPPVEKKAQSYKKKRAEKYHRETVAALGNIAPA